MQIKLFTIPVGESGAALQEMNAFLRGHKILEVEEHFVSSKGGACWCFCIRFLGYLLYPDKTRLSQQSRKRYVQKIKTYQNLLKKGFWTQKEFQNHAEPLTAFTLHADAKAFRQKIHQSLTDR